MTLLSYFTIIGNVVLFLMLVTLKEHHRTNKVYAFMALLMFGLMISGIVLAADQLRIL